MSIANTQLTTSTAAIYTSSGNSVVSVMYFCNTDSTARSFSLYAVPSAGTAGTTNQIYKNVLLQPSDTYVVDMEKLVLANGDTIQAVASANSAIAATVSYVSI
jgi:hypothetical protein